MKQAIIESFDMGAPQRSAGQSREWRLKRNCSASPKQAAALLGSVALLSVAIATMLALSGAWWVLVFAMIEVVALVAAFVAYARHAGDYERVVISPDALIIELNNGSHLTMEAIHPALTRVEYPCTALKANGGEALIGLASAGRIVGIGRHVAPFDRARLAGEIRRELALATRARAECGGDSGF